MRYFRTTVAAALVALSLGGCAPGTKLGELIQVATTTIANPVNTTSIYQIENGYAAALAVVAEYRVYCWSKPYENIVGNVSNNIPADPVMKPICERRRAVVRLAQKGKANARAALNAATKFVADNPTLNAASVIDAAWKAVADFKNSVPLSN